MEMNIYVITGGILISILAGFILSTWLVRRDTLKERRKYLDAKFGEPKIETDDEKLIKLEKEKAEMEEFAKALREAKAKASPVSWAKNFKDIKSDISIEEVNEEEEVTNGKQQIEDKPKQSSRKRGRPKKDSRIIKQTAAAD